MVVFCHFFFFFSMFFFPLLRKRKWFSAKNVTLNFDYTYIRSRREKWKDNSKTNNLEIDVNWTWWCVLEIMLYGIKGCTSFEEKIWKFDVYEPKWRYFIIIDKVRGIKTIFSKWKLPRLIYTIPDKYREFD